MRAKIPEHRQTVLRIFPVHRAIRLARKQLHVDQLAPQCRVITEQMPCVQHAIDLLFSVPALRVKANPQTPHRNALHGKFVRPAGEFSVAVELGERLCRVSRQRGLVFRGRYFYRSRLAVAAVSGARSTATGGRCTGETALACARKL